MPSQPRRSYHGKESPEEKVIDNFLVCSFVLLISHYPVIVDWRLYWNHHCLWFALFVTQIIVFLNRHLHFTSAVDWRFIMKKKKKKKSVNLLNSQTFVTRLKTYQVECHLKGFGLSFEDEGHVD